MYTSKVDFESFKEGSPTAFRLIFHSYHQLLFNYVYSFCRDDIETEDIIQEAFVTLYVNRMNLESADGIYPYLLTSAKRLTISNFRKKVVRTNYRDYIKQTWQEGTSLTEETLRENELSTLLIKVVEQLPIKQREVYRLNKFENLSYQEISEKLGISKNTVKNHLVAASASVKGKIEKIYIFFILLDFFQ